MRRYYEFVLLVLILSVCGVLAMRALSRAQDDAEEARMQAEVMSMRAQLMEVAVHRAAFGGNLPQSDNPMDWIGDRPVRYVGALDEAPVENGVWYFDKKTKELVYRFRDNRDARFYLTKNAGSDAGRGVPGGIGLARVVRGQ